MYIINYSQRLRTSTASPNVPTFHGELSTSRARIDRPCYTIVIQVRVFWVRAAALTAFSMSYLRDGLAVAILIVPPLTLSRMRDSRAEAYFFKTIPSRCMCWRWILNARRCTDRWDVE